MGGMVSRFSELVAVDDSIARTTNSKGRDEKM